ncbi:Hypp4104 [Branchiostoma lanceolatum]|uniref:Hypp4104 protein n=1 Tax=Branchiostoma lanceolatum TaxID=7740 RepID=A0A8K0A4I6_BRALA|nr:Hypp4104 [Branchiostoma lanceolatum]
MNISNDSSTTKYEANPLALPAEPAVIITVAVLSIAGNLLVVVVTTRRKTFPTTSRLFVFSLAWSDLLIGSTFPVLVAPARAGHWVYSNTAAQAIAVIQYSCLVLRLPSLAGLNLDRLYALLNGGEGISFKKAVALLTVAWVGTFAWFIFSTIYGVTAAYDPVIARPDFDFGSHMWFSAVSFGIVFLSLAVTIYCVVRILRTLCTKQQPPVAQVPAIVVINVNGVQNANPQHAAAANNRSYAKTVLLLTLAHTVTPLPAFVAFVLRQSGYVMPTYLFWSNWIALFVTFLDVVVYSVCQQSFYTAIGEIAMSIATGLYMVCCRENRVNADLVNQSL